MSVLGAGTSSVGLNRSFGFGSVHSVGSASTAVTSGWWHMTSNRTSQPMSDADLDAIEQRAAKATPGPWANLTEMYRTAMNAYKKKQRRWWHGSMNHSLPIDMLARAVCPKSERDQRAGREGHDLTVDCIPLHADRYDLKVVNQWDWGLFPRRTTALFNVGIFPDDMDFIAHARTDVPALVDEVKMLRGMLWTALCVSFIEEHKRTPTMEEMHKLMEESRVLEEHDRTWNQP